MFDIGFTELLLLGVIALLVLGPERLPGAVRFTGLWLGRIRRSFQQVKDELSRELDSASLKQDRHNESIMHQLGDTQHEVTDNLEQVRGSLKDLEYQLAADEPQPKNPMTPPSDQDNKPPQ